LKILFVLYMFIFFACLYALFLRAQRKRTSSEAAKEKAACHSPLRCWSAFGELSCAAQNNRALRNSRSLYPTGVLRQSESTPFHGSAYLSRNSGYFSAARLRDMARKRTR
jgi:hypothetical protein